MRSAAEGRRIRETARATGSGSRRSSSPASPNMAEVDVAEAGGATLLALACGAVLVLALTFGGSRQAFWPDAIVQIASLPLLGYTLWQVPRIWQRPGHRLAIFVLAAIVLLPLMQLIPLPPSVWTALPGRASIAASYPEAALGIPWLGISLDPAATWRVALTLIPPVAVFLSVVLLGRTARTVLAAGIVAFAFISVLVGLAQLGQGNESPLRFYSVTNASEAVGFFANRNHYAALLYSALPLAAAFAVGFANDRRREIWVVLALCLLVFASLLLGLGMARSRAGVGLAVLAGLGSFALAVTGPKKGTQKRANRLISLAGLAGVILVLQFASVGIMQRFEKDVADDLRWEFATTTFEAALDFMPFGTGFGTFEDVYRMYEELGQLYVAYVNHAHDDYLEALLEGGVPAVGLLVAFLVWFAIAAVRCWRPTSARPESTLDRSLPKAATLIVLLLLLHSAVDYPLRTTALSTLFAFACGLMISPRTLVDSNSGVGSEKQRRGHRRSRSENLAAHTVAFSSV